MRVIGIDGGASKVAGAVVTKIDSKTFKINGEIIEERYNNQKGYNYNFQPTDIQMQKNKSPLSAEEIQQGKVYVNTIISIIEKLMTKDSTLISIGMPGLKTKNNRGIDIMANGPRIPKLRQTISDHFGKSIKIMNLQSDAEMCVWGEEFALNGSFRKINNAYYIGGGTGIADGLKLKNQICSFEKVASWIARCWELKLKNGTSLESIISMSGINEEKNSRDEIAENLGLLFFERVQTIYSGWANIFKIDRNLSSSHSYLGLLIDKIVIGQRLAQYLGSILGKKMLNDAKGVFLKHCHEQGGLLNECFTSKNIDDKIILSKLRESPIIGLGAKAWLQNEKP